MGKVFLSHSSKDKDIVEKIAHLLGNHCKYDKFDFEIGSKTILEIFEKIESCDLFVIFISNESLNSEWVQTELKYAVDKLGTWSTKLKQIFPIIIDKSVNFDDERIPQFLRNGLTNSYNIRHIESYKVIFRLIISQLTKLLMNQNSLFKEKTTFFYGRQKNKSSFIERYEDVTKKSLKYLVISGIPGIGRRSFVTAVLREVRHIKEYQTPIVISLKEKDSIENLILNLSDAGLGYYTVPILNSIDTSQKKFFLLNQLDKLTEYQEFLIIEDNFVLINKQGEVVSWFLEVVEGMKERLSLAILTQVNLDRKNILKLDDCYFCSLENLSKSESNGYFRTLANLRNLTVEKSDIEYLTNCFYGYPPQINYAVEIAETKGGINYLKNNSNQILNIAYDIAPNVLKLALENTYEKETKALLKLISDFETVPLTLLNQIFDSNPLYQKVFSLLERYSIIYYVGVTDEYIRINPVLKDFVFRSRYDMTIDIENVLTSKIRDFKNNISNGEYIDTLSEIEINYYTKEIVKTNDFGKLSDYLYSSIFLQSIIELYNNRDYAKVIKIVEYIVENSLEHYDLETKSNIMYYYCLCLARQKSEVFYTKVEFFNSENRNITYLFLKGFNYRISGKFENAKKEYLKILKQNSNHSITKRELVNIFIAEQSYDEAYKLAKELYNYKKENIHFIYAYFECLLFRDRNEEDTNDINEIIKYIGTIYEYNEKNSFYYQIMAQYYAYVKNDIVKAIEIFEEGLKSKTTVKSYLYRDLFELYEKENNLDMLITVNMEFQNNYSDSNDPSIIQMLEKQKLIIMAYQNNYEVFKKLENNRIMTEDLKSRLHVRIEKILELNR